MALEGWVYLPYSRRRHLMRERGKMGWLPAMVSLCDKWQELTIVMRGRLEGELPPGRRDSLDCVICWRRREKERAAEAKK